MKRVISASNAASLRSLAVSALLAAVVFGIYSPVRGHAFIDFDDGPYVYENPHVTAGLTADGVAWAVRATDAENWHPLTWLSHMLDVELFGLDPGPHHLVSVGFHAANAILLFLALAAMTGATWRSAFAAFLFAMHPLHVESVAWVAERKDVLSVFFGLLSVLAYARYVKSSRRTWYLGAVGAAAMSLASKPMLVTLPFVLLLLDYWPLARIPRAESRGARLRSLGRLAIEKSPFFVLSCLSAAITVVAQRRGGAIVELGGVPLAVRAGNAIVSYATYVLKIAWPADLSVYYPLSAAGPTGLHILAAAAGLAVVTAVAVRWAHRCGYLSTGWFWFLGTLVPVIGLVQVGGQAFADRYTYFPSIGLFLAASWGSNDLLSAIRVRNPARWAALGCIAILVTLAAVTRVQLGYWRDTRSVFEHALSVTPVNAMAQTKLGEVALRERQWDAAVAHYREADRIVGSEATRSHLDEALASRGEAYLWSTEATRMSEAVRLEPRQYRRFLGTQLLASHRFEEAAAEFRIALRVSPGDAGTMTGLAVALAQGGRIDEAIRYFGEAVRLDPENPVAKKNLEAARAARAGNGAR